VNILGSRVGAAPFLFGFIGCSVTPSRVQPTLIVPQFDIAGYIDTGMLACG
jgi:hypothetical protein